MFDEEGGIALDSLAYGVGEPPLSIGSPQANQLLRLIEMVVQVNLSIELVAEHRQGGVPEGEGGVHLHGAVKRLLRSRLNSEESAEGLVEEVGRGAGRREGQAVEVFGLGTSGAPPWATMMS